MLFAYHFNCIVCISFVRSLWPPYETGGHYIFALWLLSFFLSFYLSFYLSFFPRLISAAGDWMSTILSQMVWP